MKAFHTRALWFSHQWPRQARQKKVEKSVVGKSMRPGCYATPPTAGIARAGSGLLQRSEATLQESPFGVVPRELEGAAVRRRRVVRAVGAAQELGARGMERLVPVELR